MRIIASILVILGIPWALIAVLGVGAPIAMVEDVLTGYPESPLIIIPGILFSIQSILGYIIWARWAQIAVGVSQSSRRFWLIAALQHLAWCLITIPDNFDYQMLILVGMFWYSLVVFLVCLGAAFLTPSKRESQIKEPMCE